MIISLEAVIIALLVYIIIMVHSIYKNINMELQPLTDKLKASADALKDSVKTNTPVGPK
jgi:type II secretory pathway component PulF